MRVAFNALFLNEPMSGTGRYIHNLLGALGRVDGMNEYIVLTPSAPPSVPETPSTFRWEVVPVGQPRRGGWRIEKAFWEQRTFPHAAKGADAHVMHVPHFAPPYRSYGIPVVVTIRDTVNLRLPEYRASARSQAYARFLARTARHAAAIIAVSEHTKGEIMELLGIPQERISVIREAPAPRYRRVADPARLRAVRAKYGVEGRFVLNVGGLDVRKNIPALVGAFAEVYHAVGDRDLRLFIAGNPDRLGSGPLYPDWRYLAPMFGIAERVICMPVDEADLPALYSAAAVFVYTSRYEGFGLTPLEAMACGAPVICSDRSALPEVVGRAGILVDPDDLDALGAQLQQVLADRERRDDLSARGLAHVKRFSWDQIAAETSALYTEVGGARRG